MHVDPEHVTREAQGGIAWPPRVPYTTMAGRVKGQAA